MRRLRLLAFLALAVPAVLCGCARIRPPSGVAAVERTLLVTGYCKCGECCGWTRTWYGMPVYASGPNKGKRKHVGITASGSRADTGTIAADTARYPMGTIMLVEGYGYGRVEDRGGRVKGDHIDLYFHTHAQAQKWGKKVMKVKIWFQ
jgi:3D (Asp-Asp-Asp) domain-containing protein